jgi:hypothetical protein
LLARSPGSGYRAVMPRTARSDIGGIVDHTLNH